MLKKMFNTRGLNIKGTEEQIELYSSDAKEFDYIKNSLERMAKSVEKTIAKADSKFAQYTRVADGKYACVIGDLKDDKDTSVIAIYDTRKRAYTDEITVDELNALRDEKFVETAMFTLTKKQENMVPAEVQNTISSYYDEHKSYTPEGYRVAPIDDSKKALTSNKGFYVGDPSLVLRDDILNNGVRSNSVIKTGVYEIEGRQMVILKALNGTHNGHDIYSKSIGVIPLEFVDTNKVKMLPAESLDIRLGNSINVMHKANKIFIAQTNIDVIDVTHDDMSDSIEEQTQFSI